MIPKMVDIMVHIDDELDLPSRQELDDSMRTINGVFSVRIPEDKHHLMLVAYNPDRTNSQAILVAVEKRGLRAELVGM